MNSANRRRKYFSQSRGPSLWLLLVPVFLVGCEKEVAAPAEKIRAVKTIVVGELASDEVRKFPGTIEPVESSQLSFEVDGIVQAVNVEVGDRFKKGDVLAYLDNQSYRLSVESAKAALSRAAAVLEEKKSAFERETRIQAEDPGATTQKAVDEARSAYESQVQEVTYSQAKLKLSQRDLAHTELIAPYNGTVSSRFVEPSEVASSGMHMLEVYSDAALQIAVSIPEQIIGDVQTGIEGVMVLNNLPDKPYVATVSEVGSSATAANAFPVKAVINNADQQVRPGMTAELIMTFSDESMKSAYLVPVQAFLPGIEKDEHFVYLFDKASSTVRKTPVQVTGIQGDEVVVVGGIAPGDILIVAGVPFLADGQKVKPLAASGSTQ
ncbi:efflux RND transporter periplasmic adaptor subunit [Pseudomonadota bacterium]